MRLNSSVIFHFNERILCEKQIVIKTKFITISLVVMED